MLNDNKLLSISSKLSKLDTPLTHLREITLIQTHVYQRTTVITVHKHKNLAYTQTHNPIPQRRPGIALNEGNK